ncbi:hypothetical protein LINPERPRIM_LOCUS41228 [Linum perenne]
MHWPWNNWSGTWKGHFPRGDQGVPTIMLEVVASQDLWIWHTFFLVLQDLTMTSRYSTSLHFLMTYWKGNHQIFDL